MGFEPTTYGRSFADVYDDWYGDRPAAPLVGLVARLAGDGVRVLELGVGTGRVAVPLAEAGLVVTGLDTSPEMLHVATERAASAGTALELVVGDAAAVDDYPPGPFDVVLGAFNLICNLADRAAQGRCLAAAASLLAEGGSVVLETFVAAAPPERRHDLVTRSVGADRVVLIATDTDPVASTIVGAHVELRDGEPVRLRPWRVCYLDAAELDDLAAAAGLVLVQRWADAQGGAYVPGDSPQHVSVYRRRSGDD